MRRGPHGSVFQTLAGRMSLVAMLCVVGTGIAVFFAINSEFGDWIQPVELGRTKAVATEAGHQLEELHTRARRDVQLLGVLPVEGLVDGDPAATKTIRGAFRALLQLNSEYVQLRIIDREGHERFRIERPRAGAPLRRTPVEQLQDKRARSYVQRGLGLASGDIYVSRLDLNREYGAVVRPHLPVLRYVVAVGSGPQRLLIVLNVDATTVLKSVRQRSDELHHVVVFDDRGDFVVHPDRTHEFATDLAHDHRFENEFPWVRPVLTRGDATVMNGSDGVAATYRPELDGGPSLTVAVIAGSLVSRASKAAMVASLWPTLAAVFVSMAIALLASRSLARPLKTMTAAARRIQAGGRADLPEDAPGEIGTLSRALSTMATSVDARTAELEAERLRLNRVLEATPTAMLVVDAEGQISLANLAASKLFDGRALEGNQLASLVAQAWQERVASALDRCRAEQMTMTFDIAAKVGANTKSVELSLTTMGSPGEDLVLVTLVDLAERRRNERAFEQLLESAPNATVVVDREGVILRINRATEVLFGHVREKLIGRPVHELVGPSQRTEHHSYVEAFMKAPTPRRMGGREVVGCRKDGSLVPLEVGLAPVETAEGRVVIASLIDITERKKQEDELRRSNAELERFAYVASHDLQEPLRMVVSFTELLERRCADRLDEEGVQYLAFAGDGARRMHRLVQHLLDYARLSARGADFAAVDIGHLLAIVHRNIEHRLDEAGAELDVPDQLPTVWGDEVQLERLFQNLLVNAIKFRSERPLRIDVTCTVERGRWRFAVRDNGIGISTRDAERVFQIFQRLDVGRDGDGIGLAVAQRIVERHGGRLGVESDVGEGSAFHFSLPMLPENP